MKRLTQAQSELIDAFLAEHGARVSTAQLEKDFLISEVFAAFTAPVVYREHEAKFVLCGGTAVSKAHRFTERVSEDVDLRVIVPAGLSRSAQKRLLRHVKAEVLARLRQQGYDIPDKTVKAGNENRYIAILLSYQSLYPPDQALRPELLIEINVRSPILTPVECGDDTIVNELLGRAERSGSIACLDIRETIAGKNAARNVRDLAMGTSRPGVSPLNRRSARRIRRSVPPRRGPDHLGLYGSARERAAPIMYGQAALSAAAFLNAAASTPRRRGRTASAHAWSVKLVGDDVEHNAGRDRGQDRVIANPHPVVARRGRRKVVVARIRNDICRSAESDREPVPAPPDPEIIARRPAILAIVEVAPATGAPTLALMLTAPIAPCAPVAAFTPIAMIATSVAAVILVVPLAMAPAIVVSVPVRRVGKRQRAGNQGQQDAGDDRAFHGNLGSGGFEPRAQHRADFLSAS